ncbi:MAG: gamma-glutamylcyclotransferase family protein, partial [Chloroflexota bacterium]
VQGELIMIAPRVYPRVLTDLDALERYIPGDANSLYQRVQRKVKLTDGSSEVAWTYLGNTRLLAERSPEKLPHGDWCRFLEEQA